MRAVLDELQREQQVKEISGGDSGFANLNRALDGILPGLYLLIGASRRWQDLFRQATARSSGGAQSRPDNIFQFC